MKRLLALLLALCLPMPALAETIAERIGAPETWQGEFTTNTGKSHIYVDMTVQVPDVEKVPLWAVEPHTFTVEEITRVADTLLGEGNWQQTTHDAQTREELPVEDGPRYIARKDDVFPNWTFYECDLSNPAQSSLDADYRDIDGWGIRGSSLYYWANDVSRSKKDLGTLEEAIEKGNAAVSSFAPDMVYESVNPKNRGWDIGGTGGDDNYVYRLYYAREVGGMLVTPSSLTGAREASAENPVLPYEMLFVDVTRDGIARVDWKHAIKVTEMLSEDCDLLTFEQIMDIFATVAPLSIQSMEREGNNTLTVNRATLGYMCLQERGKPTSYRLVPVWDFYGVRTFAREHYDFHNWAWLTINAIDGTIIDRELGY